MIRYFTLFICFLVSISLFAQTDSKWSAHIQLGLGTYITYSDEYKVVETKNGHPHSSGGYNIAETTIMPIIELGASYRINDQWGIRSFVAYQYHNGEIFSDNASIFFKTDINPTTKVHRWPAERELKVFTSGIYALYHFKPKGKFTTFVGAGALFVTRSHHYRNKLEVDFSTEYDILNQTETYNTLHKEAFGIPLMLGFNREINDNISMELSMNAQAFFKLEDIHLSSRLSINYHW